MGEDRPQPRLERLQIHLEGEIAVRVEAEAKVARLIVRDTGTGIEPEHLPHVFERSYRVEGARGRTYEGSGIGLALVRELAKLHGGSASVESESGKGATFTITVPTGNAHLPQERIHATGMLAPTALSAQTFVDEAAGWLGHATHDPAEAALANTAADDWADARPEQGRAGARTRTGQGPAELHGGSVSARSDGVGRGAELVVRLPLDTGAMLEPSAPRGHASRARRRVLIIEDNVDAADSLSDVLEFGSHEVEVAYSGPEGIAKARAFRPDIVLCDIGLPGMDGYDVARAFRADEALKSTFLVALSGYALPEDLRRAADAGFERHLAKPPSHERLERVLAEVPRTATCDAPRRFRREQGTDPNP